MTLAKSAAPAHSVDCSLKAGAHNACLLHLCTADTTRSSCRSSAARPAPRHRVGAAVRRKTRVRKEPTRDELAGCKVRRRGGRRVGRTGRARAHGGRGTTQLYCSFSLRFAQLQAALASSALYATSVSTRCTRVEKPRSRTASAPETRRASLSSLEELHEPHSNSRPSVACASPRTTRRARPMLRRCTQAGRKCLSAGVKVRLRAEQPR